MGGAEIHEFTVIPINIEGKDSYQITVLKTSSQLLIQQRIINDAKSIEWKYIGKQDTDGVSNCLLTDYSLMTTTIATIPEERSGELTLNKRSNLSPVMKHTDPECLCDALRREKFL